MKSHITSLDTTKEQREELKQIEDVTKIFDGCMARAGIKNVDFLESGFMFQYKGKEVELKITIK